MLTPNLPGLVDPACHAQKTPHLLEGNGCVPAASGMRTVQTQQVQAWWESETSGAQANTERLRRYLRKRQPTIGHNLSQLSSCRMSWLSIFHFRLPASQSTCAVLALPEPRRQLLPSHPAVARPMNCKSERIDATFCRRDLKPSLHHLPSCELPNNS